MNGTFSATCARYRAIGGTFDMMIFTSTSLEISFAVRFLELTLWRYARMCMQLDIHSWF